MKNILDSGEYMLMSDTCGTSRDVREGRHLGDTCSSERGPHLKEIWVSLATGLAPSLGMGRGCPRSVRRGVTLSRRGTRKMGDLSKEDLPDR